ncbi:hypothetical protein [Fusobacterium sp. IOR10]|uniref:hypothetical protein n=1 Tax=Fusobacterium sp. IOR10 TaxID=2665157 RepID=UPI0013D26A3F|nr:hypothetical protein [Fusobacterium sp. IOR10]
MNRHLSIFTPYQITSRENNLTRSLAIMLKNEPLFFDLFYTEIVGKSLGKNLLSKNIIVDTEVFAKDISIKDSGIGNIYGVTLNTVKYRDNLNTSKTTKKPRMDLIIQVEETLIVVEVKRLNEDPREQLNNQIKRLNWGNVNQNFKYKSLIWSDILDIAFNLHNFREQLASPSLYLNEFKMFIENNFQDLLPIQKLSIEGLDNKILTNRRIMQIKKEINIKIHGEDFEEEVNWVVLKDQKFAERCELLVGENKTLDLMVWPGDNRKQGIKLYKNKFILEDVLSNIKQGIKNFDKNIKFKVSGHTYIRFAHIMGKGIFWEDIPDDKIRDVSEVFKEIGKMVYKKDNKKWEKSKINISKYVKDKEEFIKKFSRYFEETNRSFTNINVGNEIKLSISFEQIEKWEQECKTADYLKNIIENMMKYIYYKA